jgi:hypothetical protein
VRAINSIYGIKFHDEPLQYSLLSGVFSLVVLLSDSDVFNKRADFAQRHRMRAQQTLSPSAPIIQRRRRKQKKT